MDSTILHISPNINSWTNDKEKNPCIVETAGFVPLEVKFKQFEQNGVRAQFSSKDFDSSDYREMYLSPNATIYPDDELEDVIEKLAIQEQIRNSIIAAKVAETDERSEEVQATPSVLIKEELNVKGNS